MNGYLLTVIGTVLLSALLTALLPEGKTSGLIKSVMKLACLLAIVSPIPSLFIQWKDGGQEWENQEIFFDQTVIETDSDFIKYYSEIRVRLSETALKEELIKTYPQVVGVTIAWELGDIVGEESGRIKILEISVTTDGSMEEEAKQQMWEYLSKNYCSEVLIE